MSNLKIDLPSIDTASGQDSWAIWAVPFTEAPRRERPQTWWDKVAYRVLMWASYHAESLWHWTYYKARPHAKDYAPPKPQESYSVTMKISKNDS